MRFFSGTRDSNAKKGIASQMYKTALTAKEGPKQTQDQKYKKMLEARIEKLQQELAHDKKKSFKLPGTVSEEKKVSAHALEWMKVLAEKKMQKEMKKQKKAQQAYERDKRFAKRAAEQKKATEVAAKQQALNQQAAASQKSYFFGYTDE